MTNPQLIDFIKQQLQEGLTKEKISGELLANGWNSQDVEEGFAAIDIPPVPASVQTPASTPASTPISTKIPSFMINPNISSPVSSPVTGIERNPAVLKMKKHSAGRAIFITLTILLLLIAAAAYIFRDDLLNIPVVKSFLAIPDVTPVQNDAEVPVTPQQEIPVQTNGTPAEIPPATPSTGQPNDQIVDTSPIIYTDPNGLYSFSYPKELKVDYMGSGPLYPSSVIALKQGDNFPLVNVYSDVNDFAFSALKEENSYKENSFGDINTYPSYKYTKIDSSKAPYVTTYVIDLGIYRITKLKILLNVVSDTNDSSATDQIEEIVKSFVINEDKIMSTVATLLVKSEEVKQYKKDFNDTRIKESLANARPSAEIYFDKKGSYTGFCKSDDYIKITKEITVSTTFNCKDSSKAWSATASLSSGYWCVDSTGYSDSSKLNTGTVCVK